MRALVQRVSEAQARVEGRVIGQTGPGFLVLICAMLGDTESQADAMAAKIAKLRVFRDDAGKMNLSLRDTGGGVLIISQFTLAADTSRGTRPGFSQAAPPEDGRALYEYFVKAVQALEIAVTTGEFGANMQVSLTNDGPVTLWLET